MGPAAVGAGFYASKALPFQNAIWHGFVVLAAECHYTAIWQAGLLAGITPCRSATETNRAAVSLFPEACRTQPRRLSQTEFVLADDPLVPVCFISDPVLRRVTVQGT